jgi:RNA polymerase sigma-70 factor (ECF subfamily)
VKQTEQLIEACLKNDRKAQFALYDLFYQTLMRIARRYKNNNEDAAALVNESFFKAFTQLDKYNADVPFEYWIKRITINTIIDNFRKHKKLKEFEAKIDDLSLKSSGSLSHEVYNSAEKDLQAKDILKLIEGLDEHERIVFNLFEIEGLHHEEIAKHLMVSERTSKRYLNQARETLKEKVTRLFSTSKIY